MRVELNPQQADLLNKLTSEMMTDEETDEESSSFVARKLTWRVEELDEFIHFLDDIPSDSSGHLQKPRHIGEMSERMCSRKVPRELRKET